MRCSPLRDTSLPLGAPLRLGVVCMTGKQAQTRTSTEFPPWTALLQITNTSAKRHRAILPERHRSMTTQISLTSSPPERQNIGESISC